ncbi:MAG: hypothetical protein E6H08_14035 [Bacteroidetes bacterium]|nr:MAG: hypothetical protein E6H08_14035 [Bacteroidota bacterium]
MIRNKNKFLYLLIFLFYWSTAFSQAKFLNTFINPRGDSLQSVLKKSRNDSEFVRAFNKVTLEKFFASRWFGWNNDSVYNALMNDATDELMLAQKLNYKKIIAWAYEIMAFIYEDKGNLTEAMKNYYKVINTSEEISDTDCIANQYYHIGRIYYLINNSAEALKYLLIALDGFKSVDDEQGSAKSNIYLGKTYFQNKEKNKAEEYFFEGIRLAMNVGDSVRIAEGYLELGNIYLEEQNFTKALQCYFAILNRFKNNSYEAVKNYSYKTIKNWAYIGMGSIYCRQAALLNTALSHKKYQKAIQCLTKGLMSTGVEKDLDGKRWILDAYLNLIASYTGMKNYKKALYYSTLFSQLKDSIFSNESYANITELSMRNEQEKETAAEKVNQEKANADKRRKNSLFILGSVAFMIIFIFFVLLLRQRNVKRRVVEKAETTHQLAQLEMQSLRSQLNPHFMFNSLNSIQTLILKEDADRSQSYLSRFAKLLRMLLENADAPFIPLRKEIDFLQLYLSLESLRVPDLQYSISTDLELDQEQTLIPNMFLQPYVENAIWHGLSYKEVDKQLKIRIYRKNGAVTYEIEDNGVGRKKAEELKSLFRKQHQSKGMELLNKRIKLLNTEYSSEIITVVTDVMKDDKIAGTLVTIKVPVMLSEPIQN